MHVKVALKSSSPFRLVQRGNKHSDDERNEKIGSMQFLQDIL